MYQVTSDSKLNDFDFDKYRPGDVVIATMDCDVGGHPWNECPSPYREHALSREAVVLYVDQADAALPWSVCFDKSLIQQIRRGEIDGDELYDIYTGNNSEHKACWVSDQHTVPAVHIIEEEST